MELTVRSENVVQTLQCSYDGTRLVANGRWNNSFNESQISENESLQIHPTNDRALQATMEGLRYYLELALQKKHKRKQFIDIVQTLERVVDTGSNDHLRSLIMTASDYVRSRLHVKMGKYIATLLQICHSDARHSLRDCVFEALLGVIKFQGGELPISEDAGSELITCIIKFLEVESNAMDTIRACLEILISLSDNPPQNFVSQDHILIIFDILNRPGTSEISEYVLQLFKVLLTQPVLYNFQYFEDVLPSLEKTLESSDDATQITAARLYSELAASFQDFSEFIRKLTSRDIVGKICYLLAHNQDLQDENDLFEEVLSYLIIACENSPASNIYCLISQTICSVLTGNAELPNGEFEFVLDLECWELVMHLISEMLKSLWSDHQQKDSFAFEDEHVTKMSKTVTCLFRISQKILLSPSCDPVSQLRGLEIFQCIIGCDCDTIDLDKLWLPFLKCNEVVQHLRENLMNFHTDVVAESVAVIDSMLKAIPHTVAKTFSMFELPFAVDRCIYRYQALIRKYKPSVITTTSGDIRYQNTDEGETSTKKREILFERLKMVQSRFGNLTVEGIDQHPTTLDKLHAAVKSLKEQKELHLIRKVIEEDGVSPYLTLKTNFVPSLLYFLIGVGDIVGSLKFPHSMVNLRMDGKKKIIRNNNIRKFLKIFLGCETEGWCPPKANNKEPFIKLINILQSAVPIVGCLHSHAEYGRNNAEVQELLLYSKSNRRPSRDVTGPDNMLDLYLIPHFDKPHEVNDPSSVIISLLNVLYGINEHYEDLYSPGSFNPPLPQEQFVNKYITDAFEGLFCRWNDSPFVKILPLHLWKLLISCPFIVDFKKRLEIFKKLTRHWDFQKNSFRTRAGRRADLGAHFYVSRNHIIEESEQYFTSSLVLSRTLEVNFKGEMGTGHGPTQEFYTVISKEFQNTKFNLWRCDTSLADQVNRDKNIQNYVVSSYGLFPKPILGRSSTENNAVTQKFELLGKIMAKALLDDKVLDLNLNDSFLNLCLRSEHCIGMTEMYKLDPQFGKRLSDLRRLFVKIQKSRNIKNLLPSHVQQNSSKPQLDGCSIDELCLDFTLPGYPEIELQKDGRNTEVNIDNIHKYIRLVIQWTLQTGVSKQLEAVRKGFSHILPVELLRIFNAKELRIFCCGISENQSLRLKEWIENCEYEYYDKESQVVKFLSEIVSEYDPHKQKSFMQFVTGSPNIPIDGNIYKNLRICRTCTNDGNNADEVLPSAMTCDRALYLPEYSNKEVMRKKLDYALQEGLNSFQMS